MQITLIGYIDLDEETKEHREVKGTVPLTEGLPSIHDFNAAISLLDGLTSALGLCLKGVISGHRKSHREKRKEQQ